MVSNVELSVLTRQCQFTNPLHLHICFRFLCFTKLDKELWFNKYSVDTSHLSGYWCCTRCNSHTRICRAEGFVTELTNMQLVVECGVFSKVNMSLVAVCTSDNRWCDRVSFRVLVRFSQSSRLYFSQVRSPTQCIWNHGLFAGLIHNINRRIG